MWVFKGQTEEDWLVERESGWKEVRGLRNSQVVQWLGLSMLSLRWPEFNPGQGTKVLQAKKKKKKRMGRSMFLKIKEINRKRVNVCEYVWGCGYGGWVCWRAVLRVCFQPEF